MPDDRDYVNTGSWLIWVGLMVVLLITVVTTGLLPLDRFTRAYTTESRDIAFRNSTQNVVGVVENLQEFYLEYTREDISTNRRMALENMAKQQALRINMNDDRVPAHVREWINKLNNVQ